MPFVSDIFMQKVEERIIKPTVAGLQKENLIYNGFIFFGLIKINDDPFVIEYNCRMGDPETEVVIPRLQTDMVAMFAAMDNGTLIDVNIYTDEKKYATVVAVSGGYPGDYKKNVQINGFPDVQVNNSSIVFHAGTKINEEGNLVTNGGRVLTVTSVAETITDAAKKSIKILEQIHFDGMYYRKDIGYEFEEES